MNKLRQLVSNTELSNGLIIGANGVSTAYLSNKIIVGKTVFVRGGLSRIGNAFAMAAAKEFG